MRPNIPFLATVLLLAIGTAQADPTWPAATDEMEEIIFQLQGFRGRLFNDIISPCGNEAAGLGRVTAAEWLRAAFHDMATANKYFQTGGIDASLQFELGNGEHTGPGHASTLQFYANYLSPRSSMADLIAAGVYAAVRSCGGPVIPLRLGRVDATTGGGVGVPQPQNSVVTFRQQFDRMGFTPTEMIQVTACGHTLGGVHSAEFPDIVPVGSGVNGQIGFDTTVSAFDNNVVTEYVDGTAANPLVTGPSVQISRHSDFKVFNSDGNETVNTMTSPEVYRSICQAVLQKMIDVVPSGVVLTDPIVPYTIKPVDMQLTLVTPGTSLLLTGFVRVRTTHIPVDAIENVAFEWKNRSGGNACGSSSCSHIANLQGVARGFDDTFGFFPLSVSVPVATGISSFIVKVNLKDGSSQIFDNNGNSYPLVDGILLQKPQSCLLQGTGALTVTALVRNDLSDFPVRMEVSYPMPRNAINGNPVPALNQEKVAMSKGDCIGAYTFYSAQLTIPGGLSHNARITVSVGEGLSALVDDFNQAGALGGTCSPFSGSAACSTAGSSSASPPSTTRSTPTASLPPPPSTVLASPTVPTLKPIVGGYRLLGCWTEGTGVRALRGASFAYDDMTLESCMENCTAFDLWGAEYGRECYCGNSMDGTSVQTTQSDCNMPCSGDATEFCGSGNRLELYSTTATRPVSSTASAVPFHKPTVGAFDFVGCQTEASGARALGQASFADGAMTLERCASFCDAFVYFGVEYGRECYCGDVLQTGSVQAVLEDCGMRCAGDVSQFCGAGNRLELYQRRGAGV
ncbi:heme peroxidase [Schizothecium vesticola]|uniref:Heme peroxidase n=1 Tax=Schizothecium vesticola TaxID=314040 RepID=A0AA40F7B4_9PEZI|nr:heme peroxidase [Schizothecium vesticola]